MPSHRVMPLPSLNFCTERDSASKSNLTETGVPAEKAVFHRKTMGAELLSPTA